MRYYLDCEFIDDGYKIDLISIGIVCEDGREFYAVSLDFDPSDANQWVRENVLPQLPGRNVYTFDPETAPLLRRDNSFWLPTSMIKSKILDFCDPAKYGEPEFWAHYADYDWVCFCQLFGTMMDLPEGYPMFCLDLQQWCHQLGNPELPPQLSGEHSAIEDAKWNKQVWEFLDKYHRVSRRIN